MSETRFGDGRGHLRLFLTGVAVLAVIGCSPAPVAELDAGLRPTPSASGGAGGSALTSRESAGPQGGPQLPRETNVQFGMSAPVDLWSARLEEVGTVDVRRIYGDLGSPERPIAIAEAEVAAGRMPVLSFKVPGNDWSGVAAGSYDALLQDVARRLAMPGGRVFVTLHHEPASDGPPDEYAAMMRHALPLLGRAPNVDAGPIVNGFWWSSAAAGLTDNEIAEWLPPDVLARSEVVVADSYETVTAGRIVEGPDTKIARFSAWARRVGVERLGVGEYNGLSAQSIRSAGLAVLADPRMEFAIIYNSNLNSSMDVPLELTGGRLRAFRDTLALADRLRAAGGGSR